MNRRQKMESMLSMANELGASLAWCKEVARREGWPWPKMEFAWHRRQGVTRLGECKHLVTWKSEQTYRIRFSWKLWALMKEMPGRTVEQMFDEMVCHEVAHALRCEVVKGVATRQDAHGSVWQVIMAKLGFPNASRLIADTEVRLWHGDRVQFETQNGMLVGQIRNADKFKAEVDVQGQRLDDRWVRLDERQSVDFADLEKV